MNVVKKTDSRSTECSDKLKTLVRNTIKKVFVNSLKVIEIRFGKDFNGYVQLRSEILRTGNDAIRDIEDIIEQHFNIEEIPEVLTIKFKQGKAKGEENGKENV